MRMVLPALLFVSGFSLADCVAVRGERIQVSDLAQAVPALAVLDPNKTLGFSPAVGSRRLITGAEIRKLLGESGLGTTAADICVVRQTRVISAGEILAALRQSLNDPEVNLSVVDFSREPVPEGRVVFPASGLTQGRGEAPSIWRGFVEFDEHQSALIWAKVVLSRPGVAVFLTCEIAAGHSIPANCLESRQVNEFTIRPGQLRSIEECAGKEAARRVPAGTMMSASMLRARAAIQNGDSVVVTVYNNGATLRFETKAQSTARLGDRVLVKSPFTGALVAAVAQGDGKGVIDLRSRTSVRARPAQQRVAISSEQSQNIERSPATGLESSDTAQLPNDPSALLLTSIGRHEAPAKGDRQ